MTREEAIKKIESELEGLYEYAEDVRGDWSGFDGRDLLRKVSYFQKEVISALEVLKGVPNAR